MDVIFIEVDREDCRFYLSHLGDIKLGRPSLNPNTTVAMYRLMKFTLRDAAIKHTNPDITARIFRDAGYSAESALYENMVAPVADFNGLVSKLQHFLVELNVGIPRIEEATLEALSFTLTVSEDLD